MMNKLLAFLAYFWLSTASWAQGIGPPNGGGTPGGAAGGDLAGTYPNPTLGWISRTASQTLAIGAGGTLGGLAFVTPGTGVATASAINIGSAGAFVLFNGAGGTPLSLTLTNATGLPIAGITGLGTNQPTFLAANLTVNGALKLNGSGTPSQAACADLSNAGSGCSGTLPTGANPTATATGSAINGSAATFMRSDGAPAVSATTINGTSCTPAGSCTVTAAAGTLTGATLAAGVTASSLTSIGTLGSITVSGTESFQGQMVYQGVTGSAGNQFVCYTNANAFVTANTAGCNISDARAKINIADLPSSYGLAAINQLRATMFDWRDVGISKTQGRQIGLIAQEVQTIIPQMVVSGGPAIITLADGTQETISDSLAVDYIKIVVPLVKAVQELSAKIDALEKDKR